MEYPVELDNLYMRTNREVTDKFLYINSCGFQKSYNKRSVTLRSKGRKDYLFLYVIKGCCVAEIAGEERTLNVGDMLIYKPHEPHYYVRPENQETEAVYIHFTGSAAGEIAGDKSVLHTDSTREAQKLLSRIVNDFSEDTDNLMSISWLLQFCELFKNADNGIKDERILKVLKYMNKNYYENNTMDFFGEMCGISADRFAHLFKKEVGISPHKYITDVRIRQAKYLLEYSDLNINEVSAYVGFEDPLYFSRIFKKYIGVSPQKYKG